MQQLGLILKFMFPALTAGVDYRIRDTGNGPEIVFWKPGGPAQPTPAEITAARTAAVADFNSRQAANLARASDVVDLYDKLQASTITAGEQRRLMAHVVRACFKPNGRPRV